MLLCQSTSLKEAPQSKTLLSCQGPVGALPLMCTSAPLLPKERSSYRMSTTWEHSRNASVQAPPRIAESEAAFDKIDQVPGQHPFFHLSHFFSSSPILFSAVAIHCCSFQRLQLPFAEVLVVGAHLRFLECPGLHNFPSPFIHESWKRTSLGTSLLRAVFLFLSSGCKRPRSPCLLPHLPQVRLAGVLPLFIVSSPSAASGSSEGSRVPRGERCRAVGFLT